VPANNIGLRVAAAPYTMFLNNDTLIYPGALAHLVDWLNAQETAGAVSGQILNADGTDQGTARRFPSMANAIFGRRSLVTRLWPNNPLSRRYMVGRHRLGSEPFEVDILSSACMVVRTAPALAMGGMDEDFQLYWVDAEMCSRFQKRGYRIWCVPDAKIMHYEGQGGSTRTFRQRCRSLVAFHLDAWYAFTKVNSFSLMHPAAWISAALLGTRCGLLAILQLLRPGHSFSSGGKN
jgi:GT2 family glycosyltransferase